MPRNAILGALLAIAATGCGGSACDDLRAICEGCPPDADVARSSCMRTVESGDERACEERIEQRTYEAYGCP